MVSVRGGVGSGRSSSFTYTVTKSAGCGSAGRTLRRCVDGMKNRATRVSSLANEEPLVVMEASVDVMGEVVRKDCGDSLGGVIREGETSLRRSGCGSVREGTFGVEDRDIGRDWGISGHRGSKVFAARRGDEDVVGVDGDVLMEWGKEESVEDFLGDLGRRGRHRRRRRHHWTSLFL